MVAVVCLGDIEFNRASALLARYGLELHLVAAGEKIPGSYWGEPEAGIIAHHVYARHDTPVHSLLHETRRRCHLLFANFASC